MTAERIILCIVWLVSFGLLYMIPREQLRLALAGILFKQVVTWLFGLIVVEYGLIEYPVRLFAAVNRSSFTFEYLAFPILCGLFNARYPADRSRLHKLIYFSSYSTAITAVEVLIDRYTHLIDYIHWGWYWSWLTLFISFYFSRLFCKWFFRYEQAEAANER